MINDFAIRLVVFACVFGGALFGMFLRSVLPERHLSAETKDTVRLGVGLIGTLAALVLGLLIASAKGFYDTQSNELTQMSAKVVLLDRVLADVCAGWQLHFPASANARDILASHYLH
jgi:hypothetical protein